MNYIPEFTNPSTLGGEDGAIDINGISEECNFVIDWHDGTGASENFNRSNLSEGEYCFTIHSLEGCCLDESCCVKSECITLDACSDATIQLPEFEIQSTFCNSTNVIDFNNLEPSGGTPPYSWQWSNGASTPNVTLSGEQTYYTVTVIDSKGCSTIENIFIEEVENLPVITNAEPLINCDPSIPGNYGWSISYIIPNYTEEYDEIGIRIKYSNGNDITVYPNSNQPASAGPGNFELLANNDFHDQLIGPDKPVKVYPFIKKDEDECEGDPVTINFPALDVKESSSIELKKEDPSNCESDQNYTLRACCGSNFGCNIYGRTFNANGHYIPFSAHTANDGETQTDNCTTFNLGVLPPNNTYVFEIYPLLSDGTECNSESVSMVIGTEQELLVGVKGEWEKSDCNCYTFVPDFPDGFNQDVQISWTDEDGNVVSSGSFAFNDTYCVEGEGNYCVELSTPFDCIVHCEELVVTEFEFEIFSISNTEEDPTANGNGQLSLLVSGGESPYLFSMVPDQGDQSQGVNKFDVGGLDEGTYCILVTDNIGCSAEKKIEISSECDEFFTIEFVLTQTQDGNMTIDDVVWITIDGKPQAIELDHLQEMSFDFTWTLDGVGVPNNSFSMDLEEEGRYCLTISHPCGESERVCNRYVPSCEFNVDVTLDHYHDEDHQGSISLYITQKVGYTFTSPFTITSESLGVEETFHNRLLLDDLDSGVYSFVITDKNGCTQSFEVEITNCEGVPGHFWVTADKPAEVDEISATIVYPFPIPMDDYPGFSVEWTDPNGNIISDFNSEDKIDDFDSKYHTTSISELTIPGKYCLEVTDGCNTKKTSFYRIINEEDCPTLDGVVIKVDKACTRNHATITINLENYVESLKNAVNYQNGDVLRADIVLINDNYERLLGNLFINSPFTDGSGYTIHDDLEHYERYFAIEIRTNTGCILHIQQDLVYDNGEEGWGCGIVDSPNGDWQWDHMSDADWEAITETVGHFEFYNKCECCLYCGGSCKDDDPWHSIIGTDDINNQNPVVNTSLAPCSGNLISKIRCSLENIGDELNPIPGSQAIEIEGEFAGEDPNRPGNCLYHCYCLFRAEFNGQEIEIVTQAAHKSRPDPQCDNIIIVDPPEPDPNNCVITVDGFCFEATTEINGDGEECLGGIIQNVSFENCSNNLLETCPSCENGCSDYEVIRSGESVNEGSNNCVINYNYECIYDLYCIEEDGSSIFINTFSDDVIVDKTNISAHFCWDNAGNNDASNLDIYGQCSGCWVPLATGLTGCDIEVMKIWGIPYCYGIKFDLCPDPTVVAPPDPPNVNPKTVTASNKALGNLPQSTTFYTAGGTANANQFGMQASSVICNAQAQYGFCGFGSVYTTTFVNKNGAGQICGSSNTFWRSGYCSCPNNKNLTFWVGGYNGNINNTPPPPPDPDTLKGEVENRRIVQDDYSFDFNSSETDVMIFALDEDGSFEWAKSFGGPGNDMASSTIVTQGGVVAVAGFFENEINFSENASDGLVANGTQAFVTTFSPEGTYINSVALDQNSTESKAKGITTDMNGNLYTVINYKDADQQQGFSAKLVKLDPSLNVLWEFDMQGSDVIIDPENINIDGNNHIYVTGSFGSDISLGSKASSFNNQPNRRSDFIVKIDSNGSLLWSNSLGSALGAFESTGVEIDLRGGVYVSGYYEGTFDLGNNESIMGNGQRTSYIAKYNDEGDQLWIYSIGESAEFSIGSISSDGNGVIGIIGEYSGEVEVGGETLPIKDAGQVKSFFVAIEDIVSKGFEGIDPSQYSNYFEQSNIIFLKKELVRAYPNPFQDDMNIELVSDNESKVQIEIYSSKGELKETSSHAIDKGFNSLNLKANSMNTSGLYLLVLRFEDGTFETVQMVKN